MGLVRMIPYNHKIKNMSEVEKAYPGMVDLSLLSNNTVKRFIREEMKELIDDELDRCLWAEEKAKPVQALEFIFTDIARARALYHFLWSVDHITDQMVKWGWDPKDISTLMKRMQKKGYDPYSIEEDTAGRFIESLHGFGRKKVETKSGRVFHVYNPKGYGEEETTGHGREED